MIESGFILGWALQIATFCLVLSFALIGLRVLFGPTAQDRIVGIDAMFFVVVFIIEISAIRLVSTMYFELALLIALLGFVATIALAKFLLRGEVIE